MFYVLELIKFLHLLNIVLREAVLIEYLLVQIKVENVNVNTREEVNAGLKLQCTQNIRERVRPDKMNGSDYGSTKGDKPSILDGFTQHLILPGSVVNTPLVGHVSERDRVVERNPEVWHEPKQEIVYSFSHQEC
jgi:hypothetical protein